MKDFAKLNEHEEKMLNIWMEYWMEGYEGAFDEEDEDFGFEEWLAREIEWYEEEEMKESAELYRQALAEWQA